MADKIKVQDMIAKETALEVLKARNVVYVNRIKLAVKAGGLAMLAAFIFVIILLSLNPEIRDNLNTIDFHHEFSDWDGMEDRTKLKNFEEFILNAVNGFWFSAESVIVRNLNSVTGITRTISLFTITVLVAVYYRKELEDQLYVDGRQAQLYDLKNSPRNWKFWLSYGSFQVATLLGSYVFLSVILNFLSWAFPNLKMNIAFALLVIVLMTAVFTGIAVFWATAMDSRNILLLALATLIAGLILSFALIDRNVTLPLNEQWWAIAISAAGRYRPASPIFTASFLSVVFAMVAVWFDLDTLLPIFVKTVQQDSLKKLENPALDELTKDNIIRRSFDNAVAWVTEFTENRKAAKFHEWNIEWILRRIGLLYLLTAICLWFVGVVPMDAPAHLHILHGFGAWGSSFAIIFLTLILPKLPYYQPIYRDFSIAYILILALVATLFLVQFVSLTGIEIIGLIFIIIWIFTTLDGLIFYLNSNWKDVEQYVPKAEGSQDKSA